MQSVLEIHLETAPRWGEEGGVPAVGQKGASVESV